jgi:hypothetical protein
MSPATLPVSQGCARSHRKGPSPLTQAMADRLISIGAWQGIPSILDMGMRMHKCATSTIGWRCQQTICPRCAARVAIRRRRELENEIASLPHDVQIGILTLTTGADDIEVGRRAIFDGIARLRRRDCFAFVFAGRGQVELLPAIGGSRRWNVHGHLLVMLHPHGRLSPRVVRHAWRVILGDRPASIAWSPIDRRFVPARGARGDRFLSGCLLRDQAHSLGVARRHRSRPRRDRARGAGQTMGDSVRTTGGSRST